MLLVVRAFINFQSICGCCYLNPLIQFHWPSVTNALSWGFSCCGGGGGGGGCGDGCFWFTVKLFYNWDLLTLSCFENEINQLQKVKFFAKRIYRFLFSWLLQLLKSLQKKGVWFYSFDKVLSVCSRRLCVLIWRQWTWKKDSNKSAESRKSRRRFVESSSYFRL